MAWLKCLPLFWRKHIYGANAKMSAVGSRAAQLYSG